MLQKLFSQTSKLWQIIWIVFYLAILSFSILLPESFLLNLVKVLSILGCLIYTCINYPEDEILILAMFVTLIADFLLAFHDNLFYGVFAFLIAQLLHQYRLTKKYRFVMFYGLTTLGCIYLSKLPTFSHHIESMFVLCGFYAVMIIANIVTTFKWHKDQPHSYHAWSGFYGFLLFLACDTCVALSYLSTTGVLPPQLTLIFNFLAWFFYYPSQILVSNSSKCATIE